MTHHTFSNLVLLPPKLVSAFFPAASNITNGGNTCFIVAGCQKSPRQDEQSDRGNNTLDVAINLYLVTHGDNVPPNFVHTAASTSSSFRGTIDSSSSYEIIVTCLHVIVVGKHGSGGGGVVVVIAGLNDGRILGWRFSSKAHNKKSTLNKSGNDSATLNSTAATLLCLSNLSTAVVDLTHVKQHSNVIFVIAADASGAVTVTSLHVMASSRAVTASRVARHFSPATTSSRVRCIVDRTKLTLSLVYRRSITATTEEEDESELASRPPEHEFQTYFLPSLLANSACSSCWSGRYIVPRGSADHIGPPSSCGRTLFLEDADAIRSDYRRVQDHEIADRVLMQLSAKESTILLAGDGDPAQQAQKMLEVGWISGGESIIAPDVCCVVVDFRLIVRFLRAVAPAGGTVPIDNTAAIALCDTAIRLLLSRPDCRQQVPSSNVSRSDSNLQFHVDPAAAAVGDSGAAQSTSTTAAAATATTPPPRCVCRVPENTVDRAIFAVHATAVALAIPERGFCVGNDFALAGTFCEVTWPPATDADADGLLERNSGRNNSNTSNSNSNSNSAARSPATTQSSFLTRKKLPEFLLTVIRYLLHSECGRVRDASRCFFAACLDRLTAAEKYALQDALWSAWKKRGGSQQQTATQQEGSPVLPPRPSFPTNGSSNNVVVVASEDDENGWATLSENVAPTQALIALLLLIRSVRAVSAPASPPVTNRSEATASVAAANNSHNHNGSSPQPSITGFDAATMAEIGGFLPSDQLVDAVGTALSNVAREYRCRSAASVTSGIALQVISEGWSTFAGFISPAERKLIICRLVMDAVVRAPAASAASNNSNTLNTSTSNSSAQQQQQLQQQLNAPELNATQPIIRMLARIVITMNLAKAIEIFAWCCHLADAPVLEAAKNAGVGPSDAAGVAIVVLRVLTQVIESHPAAARRGIHSILSFVWAAIDPAVPQSSSPFGSSSSSASRMHQAKLPFVSLLFRTAVEFLPTFAFHQPSQRVAASSGDDGKVVLYDAKTTSKLAVFATSSITSNESSSGGNNSNIVNVALTSRHTVGALAFSPGGESLAVLSGDGLWLAIWTLSESTSLFGLLSTSVVANKSTEVPVKKPSSSAAADGGLQRGSIIGGRNSGSGNGGGGRQPAFVVSQPSPLRVIFASPKCAIVSFGPNMDVMAQF